jgi:hypothetical protein
MSTSHVHRDHKEGGRKQRTGEELRADTRIDVVEFQPWMTPGMVEMFLLEYGGDRSQVEAKLRHRFDSEAVRLRGAVNLVGLAGERVVAMQAFTPWPYCRAGQTYSSFQSGNSLVHPDFRGRGIFQRMLEEGNKIASAKGIDFFMGFPGQESYGAFIRDKWTDLGRLRLWTRSVHPAEAFRQRRQRYVPNHSLDIAQPLNVESLMTGTPDVGRGFRLSPERHFLAWRYSSERNENYRYFRYARLGQEASFVLRLNRSRGVREVWIGQIRKHACSTLFLAAALRALSREVKRDTCVAALSLAMLSPLRSTCLALAMAGFIPNEQAAPLLVKPHKAVEGLIDRSQWRETSLEDVDVW